MRIPSGITDQVITFIAVDPTDRVTRETGLSSGWTVYRSRNGGTAAAFTTPTVAELDATNMPGVYTLLLDEDMTITSGNDSEDMVFHIEQASMAPVSIKIELYRRTVTAGDAVTTLSGGVDVRYINQSSTAADNLALQFDGTGVTGDTYPATQAQIGGIANVGAATNQSAGSYVLTTGTQSANLYTDTAALDNVRHTHTSTGGAMDLYYEFMIGAGTPTSVSITGYLTGSNDDVPVYGYDWDATAWVQIGTMLGKNSATNEVNSFDMFLGMVGHGANEGTVRLRFYEPSALTSATLAIDQVFCSFSQGAEGYEGGAVWFDESVTNTGTTVGVDGTATNPVSTEAAVITLLASTSLHTIHVDPGSTFTVPSTLNQTLVEGHGWDLALNGQDVDECHFFDCHVTGTATAATEMEFHDCELGTVSVQKCHFYGCTLDGTVTFTAAGDYHIINCQSGVAGSGSPTFAFGAFATTAEFRRWSGGIAFTGLTSDDTITVGGEMGTIDLGSPVSAVAVEVRGTYKAIANIGSASVNLDGAVKGGDVASILVDTGTTIPATIATAQADLDTITGADGVTLLSGTQASIDAIETDTGTTIPGTISTAQADLDIITGADGVNLLSGTQTSIDAIETDTGTTIPGTISTAQADLDIITGADGVNLLSGTQTSIDAIETDTGTTLPATLTTIDTAVDLILTTGSTGPWTTGGGGGGGDATEAKQDLLIAATITNAAGTDIAADIIAVKADTATLLGRITSTLFTGITTLADWLGLLAGDTADAGTLAEVNATTGGTDFDNTTDSLQAIVDGGAAGLTQQNVADALRLAPTAGTPAAGSVNADLDTLITRTTSGVTVTVSSAADTDGDFTTAIKRGDAYNTAAGNAFTVDATSFPAAPWATSTTAVLKIKQGTTWSTTGTVAVTHDTETITGTISLTSAETEALTAYAKTIYEIEFVNGTDQRTISGAWSVSGSDE